MSRNQTLICLDVGEKRIGVAVADLSVRIPVSFDTILVDGGEIAAIAELVIQEGADTIVVGYPRNQSGDPTAQTRFVEEFADRLEDIVKTIVFQDESLTSVQAEQELKEIGQPYTKADIDARAAAIILNDYIRAHYG